MYTWFLFIDLFDLINTCHSEHHSYPYAICTDNTLATTHNVLCNMSMVHVNYVWWISNVQKWIILSKTRQLKQCIPLRILFSCCYLLCPHQTKTSDLYVLYKLTKLFFHRLSLSLIHYFTYIQPSIRQKLVM